VTSSYTPAVAGRGRDQVPEQVHDAISAWCDRELAVRRQDYAAATYSGTTAAAASYAAGASDTELDLDEFTEEELGYLAEFADAAARRVRIWRETGYLPPADRDQLVLEAHADAVGIPYDHADHRAAAHETLRALKRWCDSAPDTPPAVRKKRPSRSTRTSADDGQAALFPLPQDG